MQGGKDQFSAIAGAVARELLGDPNPKLSSNTELRFGSKGAISVDLVKGTWFEHGTDVGGGVLSLVETYTGRKGREAVEWLHEKGFHLEDDNRGHKPAKSNSGSNRNYGPDDGNGSQGEDNGPPWRDVKAWDYRDEKGELLYQVVRRENGLVGKDGKPQKTYIQRRPDPSKPGGWNWSTKGVRQVPYRMDLVSEAIAHGWTIFIVEGEKAADRLIEEGLPATTNARGAGKWPDELNDHFKGAKVVILADDDPQAKNDKTGELRFHDDGRPIFVGIDHAKTVGGKLTGIADQVRVIQLTDRKQKEDVVDWLDKDGTVEDLFKLVKKTPIFEKEPFRSKFKAVTWSNLDAPGPEHEWLIKGLITRGETGMVAGQSQSGKSFLVCDMSLSVARGVEWFGARVRQGGVVYQAGEGAKGIKKRLRAYRKFHDISTDEDLPFVLLPSRIDLYNNNDQTDELIEEIKHWTSTFEVPLELVVIDTWSTATPGANENDGKDVSVILERCAKISQSTGAAVLIVHHMNADGAKVRGHTSIMANLENVLLVRPIDAHHDADGRQVREVVVSKNKDGEGGKSFKFVLRGVEIGKDEDGDPITSCVVSQKNGDGTDAPPPEAAQISDADLTLIRAIEKAVADHGMKPPAATGLPQNLRVVEGKRVTAAYDSLSFDDLDIENETEEARTKRMNARRQAMKRSGERLVKKGLIAKENNLFWLTGRKIKGYRRSSPVNIPEPDEGRRPMVEAPQDEESLSGALWGDD